MNRFLFVATCSALLAGCAGRICDRTDRSPGAAGDLEIPVRNDVHRVALLNDGFDALVARVGLIRQARESIDLQTFIWRNDEVGRFVFFELLEAARRGVRVRLLADQMFSENDADLGAFVASAHPGLECRVYNPVAGRLAPSVLQSLSEVVLRFRDLNQRMHNKLMVVDRSIAITGGRNLQNAYYDCDPRLNYRDRDVLVEGSVAEDMAESFQSYWDCPLAIRLADLEDVAVSVARGGFPRPGDAVAFEVDELRDEVDRALAAGAFAGRVTSRCLDVNQVAFVADLPGKNESAWLDASGRITEQFVFLFCRCRRSILIQSPYLVLGARGQELFEELTDRGTAITVSTNSLAATDSWQSYGGFQQQKRTLIRDLDLEIYEFKPVPLGAAARRKTPDQEPFFCLHSKSMVLDGEVGCVGSYNLDPRSGNLNTEVALLVRDAVFAGQLEAAIEEDMAPNHSWVLGIRYRPFGVRQVMWLFETAAAVVAAVTTLDPWPARYTACFELRAGEAPVSRRHEAFYDRYENVGTFPGLGLMEPKAINTRLMKSLGGVVTPIL